MLWVPGYEPLALPSPVRLSVSAFSSGPGAAFNVAIPSVLPYPAATGNKSGAENSFVTRHDVGRAGLCRLR
jgi:hypothetical protein